MDEDEKSIIEKNNQIKKIETNHCKKDEEFQKRIPKLLRLEKLNPKRKSKIRRNKSQILVDLPNLLPSVFSNSSTINDLNDIEKLCEYCFRRPYSPEHIKKCAMKPRNLGWDLDLILLVGDRQNRNEPYEKIYFELFIKKNNVKFNKRIKSQTYYENFFKKQQVNVKNHLLKYLENFCPF